jgi:hypothetical protein
MNNNANTSTDIRDIRNYDHIGKFKSVDTLYTYLQNKNYTSAIEQIELLKEEISHYDFQLDASTYSRHILSKKNGSWLMLIHWDKDVLTKIHGHPERSFVHVLDGLLEIESFKLNPLQSLNKKIVQPGKYFYNDGLADRFDNAVHRVHVKQQSLSLHFYSNDPTKGNIYTQESNKEEEIEVAG